MSFYTPPAMTTRRRCKCYDKSLVRRSVRLARCSVLKDLGIVRKDGKLDDEAMQDVVDCLKELLPLDLLKSLMGFKGSCLLEPCGGGLFAST